MYAIKVENNVLPYRYQHWETACKAADSRREMTDAKVTVVEVEEK